MMFCSRFDNVMYTVVFFIFSVAGFDVQIVFNKMFANTFPSPVKCDKALYIFCKVSDLSFHHAIIKYIIPNILFIIMRINKHRS